MPKRKRGSEASLSEKLGKLQEEVFRALKAAKGFERQRIAKRSRDAGVSDDKKQRLDRELSVLKTLDLHQTAKAHLYASLLKVKSIAASTDLPDEVRATVAKPDVTPDEQAALHNVTSGLYNREPVKQAIDRATAAVCDILDLPPPEKAKRARKGKDAPKEEVEAPKQSQASTKQNKQQRGSEEDEDDESVFEGFESDVDEPGPAVGEVGSEAEAEEEAEFSKYDTLLGDSSDEEEEEEEEEDFDDKFFAELRRRKANAKETANLEDISSGSESEVESLSEGPSRSPSPELKKGKSKAKPEKPSAKEVRATKPAKDTTFLPSLMGGYISGSESASDVDVAPPKKRLGQRQRQAIAEKKYGDKARHVVNGTSRIQGRDGGWDAKRGAVDGTDKKGGKPWKKGREPRDAQMGGQGAPVQQPQQPPKPTKRDDTGPLHPSWEARKKAKDAQKTVEFTGSKVTFD
ncbi:BUD22 domain-containing protein [Sarocladium implicatum]|nr:BUD22 domain-containing protein [Sarocladium implicatum]